MESSKPYKKVLDFLLEILRQNSYTTNYKLPSERVLSTKFNVSRNSVRLAYDVLINQGLVSKNCCSGYFITGKKENNNKSFGLMQKIYLIMPDLTTPFSQNIFSGISDFCDDHRIDVSIKITNGIITKESQYINSIFTSDVKGVILFPSDRELINQNLSKLLKNKFPITIIDRFIKNINSSFVSTDNYKAMVDAVKFLHSKKHKNFVYITPSSSTASSVEERISGYNAGLLKYYNEAMSNKTLEIQDFNEKTIQHKVASYLSSNPETEVIISPGLHFVTDAIISAVSSLGLKVPENIKLMSFDNGFSTMELSLLHPYIIQQNAYDIGFKSAETLYNQLYGDLKTYNIRLPATITDYTKEK